jgi:hypothetical protein
LRAALAGDYKPITDLTRVLESGPLDKRIVDSVIDQCAQCVNLREQILLYRLKIMTGDDPLYMDLALSYLERYLHI